MEDRKKIQLTIHGKIQTYPEGSLLESVAKDFQKYYPHPILLARINGKLSELTKTVDTDSVIEFLTMEDKLGCESYKRSATLILTKAVADILGKGTDLIVQFSMHKGYYCEIKGHMPIEVSLLEKIQARMLAIVKKDEPIVKKTVSAQEAEKFFNENGMEEKVKLLKYRRSSRFNLYMLEDIADYYYGYMVPTTGYIQQFELIPYHEGFVMQMPSPEMPDTVLPFKASENIFHVLNESTLWGNRIGVSNAEELNERICKGEFLDLMLVSEALQEKNIADIAEDIYKRGKRIVLIAGPSSSGKTTFSHRLSVQLRAKGLRPHPIAVDDYFLDRDKTPRDEKGNYDFECLEALNVELLNSDMNKLLQGERVELPTFNFLTGKCEYGKNHFLQIGAEDVLVIEGIHCLNDTLTAQIPAEDKYRIYISALTQLNLDEHNRIPTTDGRLIRRIVRDAAKRGASAAHTISMWYSVRRGEEANIFPYQENADAHFNSALVYELSVLKQFAEPLLFCIRPEQPEYEEAKRLLSFLDNFVGVTSEAIPKNSILREFIGGSYFNV